MVANVALPLGDVLEFDSNTPGGYTLEGHSTNATSLAKIEAGNWDYVILQEQSQRPAFPINQVQSQVFPYAAQLDELIHDANPCAETMFYMTWGRKNGDDSNCDNYPPLCTYEGMDDLLRERYTIMAEDNQASVSPVGAVWRYIRTNHPEIELYNPDESHPSLAGSYAAACSFYTCIFEKDPSLITSDLGVPAVDAATIRAAAKAMVYDSLSSWFVGAYDPFANFDFSIDENQVSFLNSSMYASSYSWDFGDDSTSDEPNPIHEFAENGIYQVSLEAMDCGESSTITLEVEINTVGLAESFHNEIQVFPNPVRNSLNIRIENISNIQLIDVLGKSIALDFSSNSGLSTVDCSSLDSGIYILKVESRGFTYSRKIVVE